MKKQVNRGKASHTTIEQLPVNEVRMATPTKYQIVRMIKPVKKYFGRRTLFFASFKTGTRRNRNAIVGPIEPFDLLLVRIRGQGKVKGAMSFVVLVPKDWPTHNFKRRASNL
jgi:hypothetical protein